MNLQFRFGIVGAGLGLLIGIFGSIIAAPPFGIVIFRIILSSLLGGGLGFGLYFVIKTFLPELLEVAGASALSDTVDSGLETHGQAVNITLPEEGYASGPRYGAAEGDQASELRRVYENHSDNSDNSDSDTSLIAEVSEDGRHSGLTIDTGVEPAFNEDAFYQGVERLPDIGGFSEQFQEHDTDGTVVGDEGTSFVPGSASPKSSSGAKGNVDPELIAKAIRTALKKDDL